jgi:hypothetical protein
MLYRPEIRRDGLMMLPVGDDLVVYDARHRRAHRFNAPAACVFASSDGTRTVQEIASRLQTELGLPEDEELVWLALDQLAKAELLKKAPPQDLSTSRRSLLRNVAAAGALLPIMESVATPSSQESSSYIDNTGGTAARG